MADTKPVRSLSFDGGVTKYIIKDEKAQTDIGTLSNLTTTEKGDLVAAINELEARVPTVEVDDALDSTSERPVQNKVIKGAIDEINSTINTISTFKLVEDSDSLKYIDLIGISTDANVITIGPTDFTKYVIINPRVAYANEIELEYRIKFTEVNNMYKAVLLTSNLAGTVDGTTDAGSSYAGALYLPRITCWDNFDYCYPEKISNLGENPELNWLNVKVALNKVTGTGRFEIKLDNDTVLCSASSTGNTNRAFIETDFTCWKLGADIYSAQQIGTPGTELQLDIPSIKLTVDGLIYTVASHGVVSELTVPSQIVDMQSGKALLKLADTTSYGLVRPDNSTIHVYEGMLVATQYVLPTASNSVLGGVKVDNSSINIDSNGVISASAYELPTASTSAKGGVKIDGTSITISNDGTISATPYELPTASTEVKGGVKVDGTSITVTNDGTISATQYILPTASDTVLGGVKVDGTTITIDQNGIISGASTYELPIATAEILGGVKVDGTTITIDSNGVISGASTYELPTASTDTLGGVKVDGTTITIDQNGVISGASTYELPAATASTLGGVKVDNDTIVVAADGTISATAAGGAIPPATTETLGGVKVDGTSITVTNDGTISAAASPIDFISDSDETLIISMNLVIPTPPPNNENPVEEQIPDSTESENIDEL